MKISISGKRSDPDAAWRLLGDTDFMNRVAGNGELRRLDMVEHEGEPTTVGTMDGPLGIAIGFRDVEMSWVAGRYVHQVRKYENLGLDGTRLRSTLEPDGDGVIPHVELELEVSTTLLRPIATRQIRGIERAWRGLLDALPAPGEPEKPFLPSRQLNATAEAALRAWGAPDPIARQLDAFLRTARPSELQQMRPFALADRWSLDREELLLAMLDSVGAGLLELYWSVRCTRCRGQASATTSLSDLADHAACPVCRIGFSTDLGSNVEVLFAPHPAVLPRIQGRFCTVFPALSPDQRALLQLRPGDRLEEAVPLEPGSWRLGALGPEPEVPVQAAQDAREDTVRWSARGAPEAARVRPGTVKIELVNDGDSSVRLQIIADQNASDRVPASLLATLGSFRRQMGHQVLAPGLRISVRSVTLLFTDLTGSTAMYEALGDAHAFALVRDHFDLLRGVVEAHGGALVKTIGDAIMAAFDSPERALAAGLAMQEVIEHWRPALGGAPPPRLRVGLHTGPSLVVHTDASGLDYFGRTVNIAARTQGVAEGGEITWTEAVHEHPLVAALVAERALAPEVVDVALKGLHGRTRLFRARVGTAAPALQPAPQP